MMATQAAELLDINIERSRNNNNSPPSHVTANASPAFDHSTSFATLDIAYPSTGGDDEEGVKEGIY